MTQIAMEGDSHNMYSSRVNVTSDREARPKRWVAALVQMNCEKKIAAKLDKLGIENYVPTQIEVHQWSDRKKKIDRIIIPMIIFVRLTKDEEDEFRRLPFIIKFITYPGAKELATPIPDYQIAQLKTLLEYADSPVTFCNHIELGDIVRITHGPLKGLTGYCCGMSVSEVAIHIELLGYAITYIPKTHLEKLPINKS